MSPLGARSSKTPSSGVTVIASTHESNSEMPTTENSDERNSPAESGDSEMAPKARIATAVAPSSGHIDSATLARAASSRSSPF